MNGHRSRPAIALKTSARIGALLAGFLYALVSLNLHDFSRPALREAGAEIHSTVEAQAISLADGMGGAAEGSGEGHRCCCKHEDGDCAMGCCKAGMAAADPGEACFRQCPGGVPAGDGVVPRIPAHLATEGNLPVTVPGRSLPLSAGGGHPLSIPLQPPEKVPIA